MCCAVSFACALCISVVALPGACVGLPCARCIPNCFRDWHFGLLDKTLVFRNQRLQVRVLTGSRVLHFSCGADVRSGSACVRCQFAQRVKGGTKDPLQVFARGFDPDSWQACCVFHPQRSASIAKW